MLRQGAEKLTKVFCKRNWVDEDRRDWCAYAVEKWLGILLFFFAVTVWTLISGRYLETLSFLVPFYLLRRRIGGYHAKSQALCFFLSIAIVIFVSAFLGAWLLALPEKLLLMLDAAAIALTLIVSPAYPPQINFTEAEKKANLVRKNILALGIFLAQILAEIVFAPGLISFGFCGICFVLITVLIQKNIIKGERENEENRKRSC
ncbi:MAG: accessory gene regulator B family protein [Candidatus Limivicinus sp.]